MTVLLITTVILILIGLILSKAETIMYSRLTQSGVVSKTRKISLSFLEMQLEKSIPEEDREKIEFLKKFHLIALFSLYGGLALAAFQVYILIS